MIPAYVINLDSSADRLVAVAARFEQAGVPFTRVPAVDGRGLDLHQLGDCDPDKAMSIYGRALTGGEYGCYKSHLACAQRMLKDGHEVALVFEDDAILDAAFLPAIEAALAALAKSGHDWRLINLGSGRTRICTSVAALPEGRSLVAAHYFPQGAFGLLWHRKGAEDFVAQHAHVSMTVDNLFRHVMVRQGGALP